jgi:hypothetical protein
MDKNYIPDNNRSNDYGIDRQLQKTKSMTGIPGINTQDIALQVGMGPVVDRTREHLGTTDRAVIVLRRLLLEAMDEVAAGKTPRGTDSASYRGLRGASHMVDVGADWRVALHGELLTRF